MDTTVDMAIIVTQDIMDIIMDITKHTEKITRIRISEGKINFMCGITGIISFEQNSDIIERIRWMTDTLLHRGPDDVGNILIADRTFSIALGNRRLAILDLSPAAHQPMSNEDETVWITYNGEIYNFLSLRKELEKRGYRFRSRSDTEVLILGYEEWGLEELLRRARGMFAFGIWDSKNRELLLARDRLGEKPLYYFWNGKVFLFASEVKALLASGWVQRRVNPAALGAFLTLGSIPAPLTAIEGIQMLPPGSYLRFRDGALTIQRYWRPSVGYLGHNGKIREKEIIADLRTHLREAVRLQLVADVPVGAFLSGGIDSSLIVALASEIAQEPIQTFSIGFQEPKYNEAPFARLIARRFNVMHQEHILTAEEVERDLPRILLAMDQPTIDGVNTYFVSKIARQAGLKVALSGLGADELFGGYPSFRLVPRLYAMARLVSVLSGTRLRPIFGRIASAYRAKIRTLFKYDPSPELAYLIVRGLFLDEELSLLIHPDYLPQVLEEFYSIDYLQHINNEIDYQNIDLMQKISWFELRTYMHNQLLRDTDVMSMAHGLEVRVPFLDPILVEFVLNIPTHIKLGCSPKHLILHTFQDKLPVEIIRRSKATFTFPFEDWLKGPWRAAFESWLYYRGDDMLHPNGPPTVWRRFLQGRVHWSRPWALFIWRMWINTLTQIPIMR
ncbi:MAG: asparagine synthase (glutamine-hydrolyzing) [Bacteroidota bacterium]|nr:asparagine synthase (glutamine-hydrolyzing) [Rhodothermia bacterium]MDW8285015.1 asparagine synthase (glutamine-hydrolyzing) [Bacteroidota bacterium]